MRFTSVTAFCFLAASRTLHAAPLTGRAEFHVSRGVPSPGPLSWTSDGAEDLSISLGTAAKAAGVISTALPIVEQVFGHLFGNNNSSSRRDLLGLEKLLKREGFQPVVLSRQNPDSDESGAISLKTLSTVASAGSTIVGGLLDLFHHSGNSTKRDEFINALLSRDTPTTAATESGAIGIGDLLKIFNIGGDIANGVEGLLGGSSSDNQQRDLVKLSSRQVVADDKSEALKLPSLSDLSSIASLASSGVDIVEQLFGHSSNSTRRRELTEYLLRRAADSTEDASEAVSLKTLGTLGSLAGSAFSILHGLFGSSSSNSTQAREFVELLARSAADAGEDGSEAISFKTLGNIGSIAGSAVSVLGDLFGHSSSSNSTQRRELFVRDNAPDLSTILKALNATATKV